MRNGALWGVLALGVGWGCGWMLTDLLGSRSNLSNAVILAHGYGGFVGKDDLAYFKHVAEHIREKWGRKVLVTKVNSFDSIDTRAAALAKQIEEYVKELRVADGRARVNIIGHSMGGLDARRAVWMLKQDEVASITTVSTPHKGSVLAVNVSEALQVGPLKGLSDLSPEAMAKFVCPDVSGVLYFSVGGNARVGASHPLFVAQKLFESLDHSPNDGMVSVESARYGEYLFSTSLNHWEQVGWMFNSSAENAHLPMYDAIMENLAKHRL